LEPEVLRSIPPGENYSFERAVFPSLLKNEKRMQAYVAEGYWIDIGTPQKYLQVHEDLLQQRFRPAVDFGNIDSLPLSANSQIDKNTLLASSVQLGEEVRVVSSSVGPECVIGPHTLIEKAVIWRGVKVGSNSKLTGCIVGRDCQIGNHVTIGSGVVLGDQSRITDYSRISA
jgi:mannose-1-phosphate guanylyltransferase